ncbi:WXG100 family type VII secretion target [Corynebacterium sphenisci]|uniref:WXG100 family type VII secretion target n=1 Tax=Corynebacterium sphenisci TaxID=191493 RepID=UPI0026DEB0CA|nr:WXG100 family type VII secretion target [Corynebacterium sphenisci]MDO5730452.1 WXG100 family type VII secretion target [Corynebacterium sphenisci]
MSNALFTTESSTMMTTAAQVDGVNAEVQGELGRLRGTVDGLAGAWQGQAKHAFDELMLRWDQAAVRLSGALGDISETIRANSRSFDAGEDAAVGDLHRVAAGGAGLLNL